MQRYEYKVVPAPKRGEKARGVKTTEERFAHALSHLMNDLGRDGWDYVRAETLPCDERAGLTGTKTTFQNMLVFRRQLAEAAPATEAVAALAAPVSTTDPAVAFNSLRPQTDPKAEPQAPAIRPPAMPGAAVKLGSADAPTGTPRAVGPANQNVAAE